MDALPIDHENTACPVRLEVIGDWYEFRDMVGLSWVDGLMSARAAVEEARFGGEAVKCLEATSIHLGWMSNVFLRTSSSYPCCYSRPNDEMAKLGRELRHMAQETYAVVVAAQDGQNVGEAYNLLTSILQRFPSEEEIGIIAADMFVPWCFCADCITSYVSDPCIISCPYCDTIIRFERREN